MDASSAAARARRAHRRWRLVAAAGAGTRREALVAAVGLTVLQAIIGLGYVRHGGFLYDNWAFASDAHFHGFSSLFSAQLSADPRRPLSALYFAAISSLVGTHQHLYLLLAAAVHVVVALALFLVLRRFALDRLSSGVAACFYLLFPFADSTWLWSTQGELSLAVAFWLLGLLASTTGLEAERRGRLWQALAIALYIASIFLQEITLPVVVLGGALAFLRVPPHRAWRWWSVELAAFGVAALLVTSRAIHLVNGQDVHEHQSVGGALHHASQIGDQGMTLLAQAVVPFGSPNRFAVLIGALVLAGVAGLVARYSSDEGLRRDLLRWLAVAGVGLVFAVAGWLMLAPADDYYVPLQAGIGNRINAASATGIVVVLVAMITVASLVAFQGAELQRLRAPAVLTALLGVAVAAGYLAHVGRDRGAYERAHVESTAVLGALSAKPHPPRPGTTIIARGFGLWTAPGVPVFAATWDLNGAIQLLWNDPNLRAWPAPPGGLVCSRSGASVATITPPGVEAPYGRLVLADLAAGAWVRVDRQAQCEALATSG